MLKPIDDAGLTFWCVLCRPTVGRGLHGGVALPFTPSASCCRWIDYQQTPFSTIPMLNPTFQVGVGGERGGGGEEDAPRVCRIPRAPRLLSRRSPTTRGGRSRGATASTRPRSARTTARTSWVAGAASAGTATRQASSATPTRAGTSCGEERQGEEGRAWRGGHEMKVTRAKGREQQQRAHPFLSPPCPCLAPAAATRRTSSRRHRTCTSRGRTTWAASRACPRARCSCAGCSLLSSAPSSARTRTSRRPRARSGPSPIPCSRSRAASIACARACCPTSSRRSATRTTRACRWAG